MKRTIIAAVAILALALVGCSDDNDNPISNNISNAKVRVAHLSPDAPAVDIWVDGTRVLQDVPYQAFSDYLEVPAGGRNVQVTPAGATTPVVINANVTLTEDVAYTVAATGLLGDNSLSPIVLVDNLETIAGSARVRFVHTSADAPSVDVNLASGPTLFGDVEFRESSDYLTVDQGTYDLSVQIAANGTEVLQVNGQALMAGVNYTVFAIGLAGDGSLAALPVVDASANGMSAGTLTAGMGPAGKLPIFPLAQKAGLKTLATALQVTGLQKTLTVDGPFTVFAPTEEAFAALPAGTLESLLANPDALAEILLYHVVEGEVKAADVVLLTEATTLNGADVDITVNGGVMINDANVIKTDIMAKNGVVHLIDKVLIPPSTKSMTAGMGPGGKIPIFPLAQKAGLKTLATALQATKLQQTLTVDGPFTVFAPTEKAFAALPPGTLESLLANPDALTQILLYHVVTGEVTAADVVLLTEATTLNGADVDITVNRGVMINDANVIQTDIFAKNGVVHLIDQVLIPPTL